MNVNSGVTSLTNTVCNGAASTATAVAAVLLLALATAKSAW